MTTPKSAQPAAPDLAQVNPALKSYIEARVFPEYTKNDWGHQLGHINYVIRRSFEFAKIAAKESAKWSTKATTTEPQLKTFSLNPDIIYTVAAYHDIGHHVDAAHHEKSPLRCSAKTPKCLSSFPLQRLRQLPKL